MAPRKKIKKPKQTHLEESYAYCNWNCNCNKKNIFKIL